eukprot:23632_5
MASSQVASRCLLRHSLTMFINCVGFTAAAASTAGSTAPCPCVCVCLSVFMRLARLLFYLPRASPSFCDPPLV